MLRKNRLKFCRKSCWKFFCLFDQSPYLNICTSVICDNRMYRPQLIVWTYEKGQIQLSLFQQNLVLNLLKRIFFLWVSLKIQNRHFYPLFNACHRARQILYFSALIFEHGFTRTFAHAKLSVHKTVIVDANLHRLI